MVGVVGVLSHIPHTMIMVIFTLSFVSKIILYQQSKTFSVILKPLTASAPNMITYTSFSKQYALHAIQTEI